MAIGEKIKARRNELQWSQRELSDRMGYSNHSTITRIEAGKVDVPQSKIVKFAEVLGVSVAYLMGWEEKIEKNPVGMAELQSAKVSDSEDGKLLKYNIDDINEQIDRLNYSWQTGKIRKVETYEKQYAELLKQLEAAEAEQAEAVVQDFSKVEAILHSGWKEIYKALDEEHKRAFWRSFVSSIEVEWTTEVKRLRGVNFF